jgi:two-component system sensor histidine kinase/response regulator
MTTTGLVIEGHYDVVMVVLSVAIAVGASYAALDFAARVNSARGTARRFWLGGGAVAMGIGIWSMHYIGMLAYRLPLMVQYDWPTVLLSLMAAIVASLAALFVVSREHSSHFQSLAGCVVMGGGIAVMHYTGMAAMRMAADCQYSPSLVALSIFLALLISYVALWLAFRFRTDTKSWGWRKFISAVVMGFAIPVMHYTGMAAVTFTATPMVHGDLTHSWSVTSTSEAGVVIVTVAVLTLSLLSSMVGRKFRAQTLELEASETRCQTILETALDAFVAVNAGGFVTDWNAQANTTFGWLRSEAVGELLHRLIFAGQFKTHEELRKALNHEKGAAYGGRLETIATHKDGHELPVEITVSLIHGGTLAAFVRDITERQRAERALRAAATAAEQANQAKSDFLANMSHEIRTPMNGIIGMTDLTLNTELAPEQREYLGMVKSSATSLLSLLNDILDFSKIEAGKLDFETIDFRLRATLSDSLKLLGVRAKQKGLELTCQVLPEVPDSLVGDPTRLRQIILNLVSNAIKFTATGGVEVRVELEQGSGNTATLHFSVRDTGIGIPEEKQRTIFAAFTQADSSMTRKYGGTGLGLAISSRLVQMMGGEIRVESEMNQGSTFHFTVQLTRQNLATRMYQPVGAELLRDTRVLIADENSNNRRILEEIVKTWGMKPTLAENGSEVMPLLTEAGSTEAPFALILLDAQMRFMDPFTVAKQVRQDPRFEKTAIILLTSAGLRGDAARCREFSIDAYLTRPVRPADLMQTITIVLGAERVAERNALVTVHSLRENRGRLRILLVEDNRVNRVLAVRLLEKRGHVVSTAEDGVGALQALEAESFDLILMDVQMPNMNGLQATLAIRGTEARSGKHVPIIAMTASVMTGDREKCLAAGMDGYVAKPLNVAELFVTIDEVLSSTAQCELADKS